MSKVVKLLKRASKAVLSHFGLKIIRTAKRNSLATHYFNTGKLTPQEENSVSLYNSFYQDNAAVEGYYDSERIAFYKEVVRQIRRQGITLDGKRVADVGCGVGYLLSEINNIFKPMSLNGYDFSEQAIECSRIKFPESTFSTHDIYNPLKEKFDIVFCTEVLEHLEFPHLALAHLVNATLPGGFLILTVPNGRVDSLLEHINFWSPESWNAFLRRECITMPINSYTILENNVNLGILSAPKF
jgi:SAM-dependent methyltransferase